MSDEFTPIYWDSNSGNDDFLSDFDDVQGWEVVPAGKYIAILTGWKKDRNKNNKPCVVLSFQIASGDYSGRELRYYRYWTVKAKDGSKIFFDSMGIDPRKAVSDYPEIWVELQTILKDGADGRQYTEVQSVQRIVPPEEQTPAQTSNPVPGSGSFSQSQGTVPGAF